MNTREENFFGLESFNSNSFESLQKQESQPKATERFNNDEKDKQLSNQDLMKTPKSKLISKLSSKTNPQDFSPSKTPKLKPKKSKLFSSQKQKNPNQLSGHWSLTQNKRYHWFLQTYYSHFLNRSMRRMDRVFTSMSKFVGTREAQQCRSHHQKMQKKYKSFAYILLNLRKIHYDSHDDKVIKTDMDENKIVTTDVLLTEQFLFEHMTRNDSGTSQQREKQEMKVESPFLQSQQQIHEEPNNQHGLYTVKDIEIEEIMPFELESSKNDCFRFLSFDPEKNNIMDDEYENKLTFDPFL